MSRYLGNKSEMEVHDLQNKQTDCQIGEIKPEHTVWFTPDTLDEAHRRKYDNCAWCIGGSKH
jgi:hypothetical protein